MLGEVAERAFQEALFGGVAALIVAGVTWYASKRYYDRDKRLEKLEKTHQAVFGMDDVDTMEGIVEVIEEHDKDIEELHERVEEGKRKRKEIKKKLDRIMTRIDSRRRAEGWEAEQDND